MKKILLTGGGTAGHVTPNIALLPRLREAGFAIEYVGTRTGIEYGLIQKENLPFHTITAGKLRRYFDLKNISDLFRIALGLLQAIGILLRSRPDVVFSKGGFVSCPVVWAAWLLKIPAVIHESDITPGLANKLSLPFARKICYSFPETASHVDGMKSVHTGLPVRASLLAGSAEKGLELCGFTKDKPVVLVMGGSQGSVAVNSAVRNALPAITRDFNLCHLCGKGNLGPEASSYYQFEYVSDELPHLLAATTLFVGRSGATTLFELLALKKPSLLIPLSTGASRGDQILNARSFEKQGFCEVLPQEELTEDALTTGIQRVFSRRQEIIGAIERGHLPDGTAAVTEILKEIAGN
ncbi:MAG: undecaprenyldiphospho-muramoylpentapeptide beta-N-acetylglucosaminyltransferase [Chitinispirillaceae bacterium]|nr:undecaprenyldiphospho-muramoylpentapeptide beta-N-acetylglucosaminyltransferase [Chitinispirillaceae bacterium]